VLLLHDRVEELDQVVVVWLLLKLEMACVREVLGKLICSVKIRNKTAKKKNKRTREAVAQLADRDLLLLLANLLVLLLVGGCLESLPGQAAAQKVHEYVPEGLEIVASALLTAQVRVDTHVACRARQALLLAVRNVDFRVRVPVVLGHAVVYVLQRVIYLLLFLPTYQSSRPRQSWGRGPSKSYRA